MSSLADRAAVPRDVVAELQVDFARRARRALDAALDRLVRGRRLHPSAIRPTGLIPASLAEMLAVAVAAARDAAEAERLRVHYLDYMPAMLVEQTCDGEAPGATLFHTPLDWTRLPRLSAAAARLDALLVAASAPPSHARGAATVASLYATTHYGGLLPLLYGAPADLAFAARRLGELDVHAIIDHYLCAPLVHELTHLRPARRALQPVYLDECIAGWLGVHVFPGFAYPDPPEDTGLYASPWFAQVGLALARAVGVRALVAAHAGVVSWEQTLPGPFIDDALSLGWRDYQDRRPPHFLADAFSPQPWLELVFRHLPTTESDADDAVIEHALRSMCLRNYQEGGSFRVQSRVPEEPVEVDLVAGAVTAPPGPDGWDPVPLWHWLPPAVARRLQDAGTTNISLRIPDLGAIPTLARVLRRGLS